MQSKETEESSDRRGPNKQIIKVKQQQKLESLGVEDCLNSKTNEENNGKTHDHNPEVLLCTGYLVWKHIKKNP